MMVWQTGQVILLVRPSIEPPDQTGPRRFRILRNIGKTGSSLTRAVCTILDTTQVINTPGSPKADCTWLLAFDMAQSAFRPVVRHLHL